MGVFGDTLRQARVSKGVTLREAEQATRINRHHLSSLEDEDFAVLPPLIYQRGIVRNYSTYLDLDPGKTLAMFEEARGGDSATEFVASVKPLDMPRHWSPNFAIIAFMVVMGAVIFAWVYSITFSPEPAASTVPPAIPTVTPIPDDQLALPSPTAIPTATAAPPTVTPIPSVATVIIPPTQTQANVPIQQEVSAPIQEQPALVPTQAVAVPAVGAVTLRLLAKADIEVTIVADGTVVYSGWLGGGTATEWYSGTTFAVTTTDGNVTLFENAAAPGQPFFMGYGFNETYYLGG